MTDVARRPAPLEGLRILDLSRVVAGPFCTQVLGDLGAEVIRVQHPDDAAAAEPGPMTAEEAMSWALNRNKRSVSCDLKTAEGRALLQRLAASSDVVFDNFRPGVLARLGLDREALVAVAGDHLITCSLSGFGSFGALSDVPAYDPIVQAMSGLMHLTRAREEGGTPVKWGAPIGDLLAGLFGCIGILAAVIERSRSGRGQHVEVAMLDVMLALNTVRVPLALSFGQEPGPTPYEGGQGTVPYGLFRCADGWISIGIMDRAWGRACELIGRPDLADDPRFRVLAERQRNLAALVDELQSTLVTLPADVVEARFLANGIPAGRVLTVDEVVRHPQVVARGMVVELADERGRRAVVAGDPLGMADRGAWRPPSAVCGDLDELLARVPAVGGGARTGVVSGPRRAPLGGITLVEMDGDEPSKAFAAQVLADLGARVIRVDRPAQQQTDPYPDEIRASAFRCALNRNKESVTADLRSDAGKDFVHALVRRADVLLDNYRPGVLGRLGLDDDTVRALAPDIVTCSITGFGHTGPWGAYPAFDAAIQALGGAQALSVAHDDLDTPVRCGSPIGGLTGALYAAIGILAALRGRDAHGGGRRIDLSLLDAQVSLLSYRIPQAVSLGLPMGPQPRVGGTGSVPYGVFPAADGTWIVIGITDQFWIPFCEAVERPEWISDGRFVDAASRREHAEALHALLEVVLATETAQRWQERFAQRRLPAAAVATISEAFLTDHVVQRGMRVRLDDAIHPDGVVVAGQPIKLSACGPQAYRPAPRSGADTEAVRTEFLTAVRSG